MDEELIKKLKDAGFSKIKTFTELVNACGDKFDNLRRMPDGNFVASTFGFGKLPQVGSTPKEAVAKLLLSLKKTN